ncbi:hypothetical protein A2U01_0100639, partial [Trifolium medium]|nr:hypothetical protein [Trifolium medium]
HILSKGDLSNDFEGDRLSDGAEWQTELLVPDQIQ